MVIGDLGFHENATKRRLSQTDFLIKLNHDPAAQTLRVFRR